MIACLCKVKCAANLGQEQEWLVANEKWSPPSKNFCRVNWGPQYCVPPSCFGEQLHNHKLPLHGGYACSADREVVWLYFHDFQGKPVSLNLSADGICLRCALDVDSGFLEAADSFTTLSSQPNMIHPSLTETRTGCLQSNCRRTI